jgi:hypothetical protein
MSNVQLKSEIDARGLDSSGSNIQLIDRLKSDDRRRFSSCYYTSRKKCNVTFSRSLSVYKNG